MKHNNPRISIIIPTLNEAGHIVRLLDHLKRNSDPMRIKEILVVDGGSEDTTPLLAAENGAVVLHSRQGRAVQLNLGAEKASGDILYFLHADTFPPANFDTAIMKAVDGKYKAGCFRMRFDSESWFLSFFTWFSRFNHPLCRGGDQSLFVTRSLFYYCVGFNETYRIYEDNEFTSRLYKKTSFTVLPGQVTTSARKYREKNSFSLQFHFGIIHLKKLLGAGPDALHRYYSKNIAL